MKESDMREKIDARGAWYGGKGEEKNGKANLFSVLAYQNSISTKWRKNCSKNRLHIFGLKCPLRTGEAFVFSAFVSFNFSVLFLEKYFPPCRR